MIKTNIQRKENDFKNYISTNQKYESMIDYSQYPLFSHLIPKERQKEIHNKKNSLHITKQRLTHTQHDLKNFNSENIPIPIKIKLLYNDNNTLFNTINNKPRYKDISPLQILKILYHKRKITRFIYKNSIKRIHNNEKLKSSVIRLISAYYTTIKSNVSKNNISAITRKNDKRTRLKISGYSVLLKERTTQRLNNHIRHEIHNEKTTYRTQRLNNIYSLITTQFNKKLINDNDLIPIDHNTKSHK